MYYRPRTPSFEERIEAMQMEFAQAFICIVILYLIVVVLGWLAAISR
jgi:hypothetical protein